MPHWHANIPCDWVTHQNKLLTSRYVNLVGNTNVHFFFFFKKWKRIIHCSLEMFRFLKRSVLFCGLKSNLCRENGSIIAFHVLPCDAVIRSLFEEHCNSLYWKRRHPRIHNRIFSWSLFPFICCSIETKAYTCTLWCVQHHWSKNSHTFQTPNRLFLFSLYLVDT